MRTEATDRTGTRIVEPSRLVSYWMAWASSSLMTAAASDIARSEKTGTISGSVTRIATKAKKPITARATTPIAIRRGAARPS